jgi:hypothetical protein
VIGPEHLLHNRQGALEQRPRGGQLALVAEQIDQVVEAGGGGVRLSTGPLAGARAAIFTQSLRSYDVVMLALALRPRLAPAPAATWPPSTRSPDRREPGGLGASPAEPPAYLRRRCGSLHHPPAVGAISDRTSSSEREPFQVGQQERPINRLPQVRRADPISRGSLERLPARKEFGRAPVSLRPQPVASRRSQDATTAATSCTHGCG